MPVIQTKPTNERQQNEVHSRRISDLKTAITAVVGLSSELDGSFRMSESLRCLLNEETSSLRQMYRAVGSFKELDSERFFQLPNLFTERRLGNVKA